MYENQNLGLRLDNVCMVANTTIFKLNACSRLIFYAFF